MEAQNICGWTDNVLYANLFFVGPRGAGKTTLLESFLQPEGQHSLIPPATSGTMKHFYAAPQEWPLEPVRFPHGKGLLFLGYDVPGPLLEQASLREDRHQEDDQSTSGHEHKTPDDHHQQQQQQRNLNPVQTLEHYINTCTIESVGLHSTVLICIDLSNDVTRSAEAVKEIISVWTAMTRSFDRHLVAVNVTFWLIGCKSDLRSSTSPTKQQLEAIAEQCGLAGYRECSKSAMDGEEKGRGLVMELARNTRESIAGSWAAHASVGGGRKVFDSLSDVARFMWYAWRKKRRLEQEAREILGT